jgi:hypothetical protein
MPLVRARPSLRNVESADVRWVGKALGTWECSERWDAVWALTPRPEVLTEKLWHDVAWQQVVHLGRKPTALVQLAGVNLGSGIGHLELLQSSQALAASDEPIGQCVATALEMFSLRKLVLMAGADCLTVPPSVARAAECVGVLKAHLRRRSDSFADLRIYEIWHA